MSVESVEAQLARVDERWSFIVKELTDAASTRKDQYEKIEEMGREITAMKADLTDVKGKLASAQPTIEEFITIKHKVVGAGKLGHWIWMALCFLLGATAASRVAILHWLSGK